jgi:hypothetical protein
MRIQFEFSDPAIKDLDNLRTRLNLKHRGEVVNTGLGTLKWLVSELSIGNTICVRRKDAADVEVIFPNIEIVKEREALTKAKGVAV